MRHSGTRTTSSTVSFAYPFRVGRDDRELPPGTYPIHTIEERYEGAFEPLFVQICVELVVEDHAGSSTRILRPADLRAAMARDAASVFPEEASENPDRGISALPSVTTSAS